MAIWKMENIVPEAFHAMPHLFCILPKCISPITSIVLSENDKIAFWHEFTINQENTEIYIRS